LGALAANIIGIASAASIKSDFLLKVVPPADILYFSAASAIRRQPSLSNGLRWTEPAP